MVKEDVENFSLKIEAIVENYDISYIEAILLHCESSGVEVDIVSKLISSSMKTKIQFEAEELHFLPKSNTTKLPF